MNTEKKAGSHTKGGNQWDRTKLRHVERELKNIKTKEELSNDTYHILYSELYYFDISFSFCCVTPGPHFAIMCQHVSIFLLHDTFIANTASNSQIITIVDQKVACMLYI